MDAIIKGILEKSKNNKLTLVAIDGMPGGGKSTLLKHILLNIPSIKVVKMDNFFNPLTNGDDISRVKKEVLVPLKNNQVAKFKIFDWKEKKLIDGEHINPEGIVIVEGICSMDRNLIDSYDYKIWVDCSPEVGQSRALARDKGAFRDLWINKWIPETIIYIKEQKPNEKADIVINYKDIPIFE